MDCEKKIRCPDCRTVLYCDYEDDIEIYCHNCGEMICAPYAMEEAEYNGYELAARYMRDYYREIRNEYSAIKNRYGVSGNEPCLIKLADVKEEPYDIEMAKRQTAKYIDRFVNCGKYNLWPKGLSPYEKSKLIMQNSWIDDDAVAGAVNALPYHEFLETLYWEAISEYKRYDTDYKCEKCGTKNKRLDVHHKTYRRHGYEHCEGVYYTDLIALCETCHAGEHQNNFAKQVVQCRTGR